MGKKSFYEISSSEGHLREGSYLEVRRQINYHGERADFKPFLNVPMKDLEKQLKASQAEEKKVFEAMKKAITTWDQHGAQTLLLQKTIEYLRTPEVMHTGNEWKRHKNGSWEISNLVYKMTFQIIKAGNEWKLSWELSYTAPGLAQGYWSYTRSPRERIEYEGSKKYKTLEGAQKYVQSRFDLYADRFESLSPPIPAEAKELSAHYYSDKKIDRVVELIQLPREKLADLEKDSVQQEEGIFAKFSSIAAEWRKQAAETVAIRKAREYLRALPVEHTSNQWKRNQFGWNVLSNMVYEMSYRVSENKKLDGTLINCSLSWNIHYNTLHHPAPDYTGDGWKIAGQSDKRFATKKEMERYLQGRINAYAHLFAEISPPIPKDQKNRFCVNGVLLPGYTVETPVEERVDELLSFLEDDLLPTEGPVTPKKEFPQTARKGPKRPPHRKTAPVR